MIVQDQSNEFCLSTSPMMWEQFPYKSSQPQPLPQRKQRGQQLSKASLHGTYTIFWQCPSTQNLLRYDITLKSDKTIKNFILDAAEFFSQNSTSFIHLYEEIDNVQLFIAKENGSRSTTYPPVSIQEVPTVFTLFKTQRKRFFLLEIKQNEDDEKVQENNSSSTNSSELLIDAHKKAQNYRQQTREADKAISICSKSSKIYNNSFHSQTHSHKDSPPSASKPIQQAQVKNNKAFCWCFCD
ncbi:hypothetical protein ABPG74_009127 [Tetrahymena malaccensis]